MKKIVPAGEFKAKCLQMMDEVMRTQVHLVITKRSIPIAEMVPIEEKKRPYFGWMQGTIEVTGDIIAPIDEEWNASH